VTTVTLGRVDRSTGPDPTKKHMIRHLFIVSRRLPWFYEYLLERFADDSQVAVIYDRRIKGDRRQSDAGLPNEGERRRGERRLRQALDAELEKQTHILVDLDLPPHV
jgi:hypothetical protein